MSSLYFIDKLLNLIIKPFLHPRNAKTRLIKNKMDLNTEYLSIKTVELPDHTDCNWEKRWE